MKRFDHYSYMRGSGVIEITIRDETGTKMDTFKANINDIKTQRAIGLILKEKYDIILSPVIPIKTEGFFDT